MNINEKVLEYQVSKEEEIFEDIYKEVIFSLIRGKKEIYFKKIASNTKTDTHDVAATFDDTVFEAINKYKKGNQFIHYFKWLWKRRITNLYNKEKSYRENVIYDEDEKFEDEGTETLLQKIPITDLDCYKGLMLQDQRQLIRQLTRDENERTTAIVQTFLSTELTPTAIGKKLGLHHEVVKRALTRLAAKHNPKQYGSHRDYLVAL